MEEKWDFLIVLDACRYDYFERIYPEYMEGDLSKALSVGGGTVEWRDNSFPDVYDDVVYVSSNPYINSLSRIKGFLGSEHFSRVYDVWADGWDEKKGTVLPGTVSAAARRAIAENENKRCIIHYLQPHAPYLGLDLEARGFPVPDVRDGRVLAGVAETEDVPAWKRSLLDLLTRISYKTGLLGENPAWKLRQYLGMAPASPMDAARRAGGDAGLRAAYEDNLRRVLKDIAGLLPYLSGRIVITADHGEWLGENGSYSHRGGSQSPILREVPWLVIEKGAAERKAVAERKAADGSVGEAAAGAYSDVDRKKIEERLRGLGYIE
ncbi:MAG: hypothetical protein PVF95_05005 [bacterium]|jgi:hypothetical protein